MVLLLCTNYSTGKEEGCLYSVLLESFTLSSLVCMLDVCYRRKETTSDNRNPLLQCWWFLCLLYISKYPTHSASFGSVLFFHTWSKTKSRQSGTVGSVLLYTYQKAIVSTQRFLFFFFFPSRNNSEFYYSTISKIFNLYYSNLFHNIKEMISPIQRQWLYQLKLYYATVGACPGVLREWLEQLALIPCIHHGQVRDEDIYITSACNGITSAGCLSLSHSLLHL